MAHELTLTAPAPPALDRSTARGVPAEVSIGVPPRDRLVDGFAAPSPPRWARPALLGLLVVTAAAYLYNLSASGYGNDFYAAAVQAGTKSWKALLFGSLDSSNFITVDKPPAALWVMDLSARVFGFNTWSVMVPNVIEGVASVALLYGAVRRVAGSTAGLAAGAVLALTPVAVLMFRFDNPDSFLVLLLVGAAYCVTRGLERAGTRWIVAAGALLGLAFLAKMLQAFTVVPALGLVYLVAAPTTLRRRLVQLLAGMGALVLAGGWWVALVELMPAADRPFVDGSPDNSILNLIFVYNGFGRLTGGSSGAGASFSGTAGVFRLFNDVMGGQASWLLPAAGIGLLAVLVARRGTPRTDRVRAAVLLWGGWLLVTGVVFSFSRGIIHTYYTVALAPAIAALVAIGGHQLWARRGSIVARVVAAAAVVATGVWAWYLLDLTPSWAPSLRVVVVVAAVAGGAGILAVPTLRRLGSPARRLAAASIVSLVLVGGLGGPLAFAADTIRSGHSGGTPSAGPASSGAGAFGTRGTGFAPGGRSPFGGGELPAGSPADSSTGAFPGGLPSGPATGAPATGRFGGGTPGGGVGGGGVTTSRALVVALEADASKYRWVAATGGSNSAAALELATGGEPVMAIGGFDGQGGNLTLAAFEAYVAAGRIHYFIGGASGGPGGSGTSAAITSWVQAHYSATTIGGQTVYDLTAPTAGS